jgi:hypothetical protein
LPVGTHGAVDGGRHDVAKDAKDAHDTATRGFPVKLEMPFGLSHLHK